MASFALLARTQIIMQNNDDWLLAKVGEKHSIIITNGPGFALPSNGALLKAGIELPDETSDQIYFQRKYTKLGVESSE